MRRRLDNEVGPDQLVAVIDARGASALQVTRKVTLIKETALALNQVRSPCSMPCRYCSIGIPLGMSAAKGTLLLASVCATADCLSAVFYRSSATSTSTRLFFRLGD